LSPRSVWFPAAGNGDEYPVPKSSSATLTPWSRDRDRGDQSDQTEPPPAAPLDASQ
jgi:hypothetical protein